MSAHITLVLGGVRSGKSAFAERLARELEVPTLYLATAQISDSEMEGRIRRHRDRRPSDWGTVEEPLDLASALRSALLVPEPPGAVLLDSLDVWVSNLLLNHENELSTKVESLAMSCIDQLLEVFQQTGASYFLVSSEVGLSLVPPNPLGRRFQDLLGLVNQRVAAAADRIYLVVAGIPVEIKGG
jgi:adenosylcobinamide kinase/adenosylcobinamide-phosphate guanylyltransferase